MKKLFFPVLTFTMTALLQPALAQAPLGTDAVAYIADPAPEGFDASFASSKKLILLNGKSYDLTQTSVETEAENSQKMGDMSADQRFTVKPPFHIAEGDVMHCKQGAKVLSASEYDGKPGHVQLRFFEGFDDPELIGDTTDPCLEVKLVPAAARADGDDRLVSAPLMEGQEQGEAPDQIAAEDEPAQDQVAEVPAAPVEEDVPTKWVKAVLTNPIDDTKTVQLRLVADRGTSRYGETVSMIARCKSNTTEVYVDWKDYLGDDSSSVYSEWKYVVVRVGDAKAQTQKWSLSTDSKATFAPEWAGNLLKQMLEVDQVIFQTTPYNESPVTAIFDVRGLRKDLRELADTCGWSF